MLLALCWCSPLLLYCSLSLSLDLGIYALLIWMLKCWVHTYLDLLYLFARFFLWSLYDALHCLLFPFFKTAFNLESVLSNLNIASHASLHLREIFLSLFYFQTLCVFTGEVQLSGSLACCWVPDVVNHVCLHLSSGGSSCHISCTSAPVMLDSSTVNSLLRTGL